MSNKYNADAIQSLGMVEGVRAKPASIGLEGAIHTLNEILANAVDEHREGYGNEIIIAKHEDNSISVRDFGRSIPMGKNSKGEYAYKKIFDEMWGGGKYANNSGGNYEFSCGTNGCGNFGVSKCSDYFEAIAYAPNNIRRYIRYEYGYQSGEYIEDAHNEEIGTLIKWIPSANVFKGDGEISDEFILTTIKQQSIINKGLRLSYIKQDELIKDYYYENGIPDYIKEIDLGKSLIDTLCFSYSGVGRENNNDNSEEFAIKGELYFTFNNEVSVSEYYHNGSYLENRGTPDDFIRNGFTCVIDKYIKDKNMYGKNEKKITFQDIQDSLIVFSDTYSTISLYTDQAKKQIKSKFMNDLASESIKEQLTIYLIENPIEAEKIANQLLINKRSREKANQTRLNIQKKLSNENKGGLSRKIEGLKDCDMRHSTLEERIFLVDEGLSANSTIIEAFDNRYMGCMGLRGKFINSLKSSVTDVLNNEPALGIIQALGCGIEIPYEERKKFKDVQTFNLDNLRYGSIGILCDFDGAGRGITLGIITFFKKFMPTLLNQGRVYVVISPRYEIRDKTKKSYYVYNEVERDEIIAKLGKSFLDVSIRKGLGEFNKEEFWELVLSPDVRENTFIKLIYDETEDLEYWFNALMGEDIDGRKKFIRENITNVKLDDLN